MGSRETKPMSKLEEALLANRQAIDVELRLAREELADLDQRRAALWHLIARAEALLGVEDARSSGSIPAHSTLHAAIEDVLRTSAEPMTARAIADQINRLGTYRRRDGAPVDLGQVHARVHAYSHRFERTERGIRLANPL